MGSIIVPKKSGCSIEPPQYTYREMPQAYKYYKDLREEDGDLAYLCFNKGGCGFLYFGAASPTKTTTFTVYGGPNGTTPLYKWRVRDGWYHYSNNTWVKNTTQPSELDSCKTYEMDLDNYPYPRGLLFEELQGKSINDPVFGEQQLITIIQGGNSHVKLVNHTPYGSGIYGYCPVFAYYGGPNEFSTANNLYIPYLEFVELTEGDTAIPNYAFHNDYALKYIQIPASVTSIGQYAFSNATALERIDIKGTISTIGPYAFRYCSSLYTIDLSHVTSLGPNAFEKCKMLDSIKLASELVSIPNYCFNDCASLTKVIFPEGLEQIGNGVFENDAALRIFTLPSTLTSIGNNAFRGTAVTEVTIPDGVTTVSTACFQNCAHLKKVILPNGITTISSNAFSGCVALEDINIPSTVSSIGGSAFNQCYALREFDIPTGVTDLSGLCFQNCEGLRHISVPSGITKVGTSAFSGCRSLIEFTLPPDFPAISQNMLLSCYSLRNLTIPATVSKIDSTAFGTQAQCMFYKLMATTPPTLANTNAFSSAVSSMKILVPYLAYDNYQTATNWSSSNVYIKERQRGWGVFTAGETLPTTVGSHSVHWYTLNAILKTTASGRPVSGEITVAPSAGEYYCYYE